jgi:hypothetical protein
VDGDPTPYAGGWTYPVFFGGDDVRFVAEAGLELLPAERRALVLKRDEFLRALLLAKLENPLSNILYWFQSSRTHFEPYQPRSGYRRRLTEVGLDDDAKEHLDHVVLVGGATKMPMITEMFKNVFGDRLIEPELVGTDRAEIVALGLARPKPPGMASLRYPSWGISAVFRRAQGETEVPMYEPFAPTFQVYGGATSRYVYTAPVPAAGADEVALAFRSVDGQGTRWPFAPLPASATSVEFEMSLFGTVQLAACRENLYPDHSALRTPWAPAEAGRLAEWLPPWTLPKDWWNRVPDWDLRNDE